MFRPALSGQHQLQKTHIRLRCTDKTNTFNSQSSVSTILKHVKGVKYRYRIRVYHNTLLLHERCKLTQGLPLRNSELTQGEPLRKSLLNAGGAPA